MTLLQPTEAPEVHIEPLPASTLAAQATIWLGKLRVTAWAPSTTELDFTTGEGNVDAFFENQCDGCEFYTEELEWNNEPVIYTEHGDLQIRSTYYTDSPCPCYRHGIGEVEFPCIRDLEPEDSESEGTLPGDYMVYAIDYDLKELQPVKEYAWQQACLATNDGVRVGDVYDALNCFSPNHDICWGGLTAGNNLLEIENLYTRSKGNDDLTTPEGHVSNHIDADTEYTDICDDPDEGELIDGAVILDHNIIGRGKALIVATSRLHPSAYLLMGASGVPLCAGVASIDAYHYSNVAITDDYVCHVWATAVLKCGKRLLFTTDGQLLGQVDPDFPLETCTSQKQPSLV